MPLDPMRSPFEIKEGHVALFKRLCMRPAVSMSDSGKCLEIRPCVDWKRPFGNEGAVYDACRILDYAAEDGTVPPDLEKDAMYLIAGLPVAVEHFAETGEIKTGTAMVPRHGAYFHYENAALAVFWKEAIEKCAEEGLDADRVAEFVMGSATRNGNPYFVLWQMRPFCENSEKGRRVLEIFQDEAVARYERFHGRPGHDRAAVLAMLDAGTAGMERDGWPFPDGE